LGQGNEYKWGDEFVQNTLHTSMELSQWNTFVLLMCANKNKLLENKKYLLFIYTQTKVHSLTLNTNK
jgi:hypothetical protein